MVQKLSPYNYLAILIPSIFVLLNNLQYIALTLNHVCLIKLLTSTPKSSRTLGPGKEGVSLLADHWALGP